MHAREREGEREGGREGRRESMWYRMTIIQVASQVSS